MKKALSIAGSDPSCGAGIQADIKTFARFGVYGLCATSAYTVQNSTGVKEIFPVPEDHLYKEMEYLLQDFTVSGVKTGMLGTKENVLATSRIITEFKLKNVVIDPVMPSSSGFRLLNKDGVAALIDELIPKAILITPNIPEASILSGINNITSKKDMERAAVEIKKMGAKYVLIKGGHSKDNATDILYGREGFTFFESPRIEKAPIHGTGCILSAAITSGLALGKPVGQCISEAKSFITELIKKASRLGSNAYYLI